MSVQTPLSDLAARLEASGDYRVLRRFVPQDAYFPLEAGTTCRTVAFLDTETTGLDCKKDKIIELGYLLVRFDPATGRIFDVVKRFDAFEDPGFPLSADIIEITGITDADVAGQKFNDDEINADFDQVDLFVAHNAPFDRGFMEARFPIVAGKWWACSQRECPWTAMKTGSTKLEYLAYRFGLFYSAHRALTDAAVLLHLLATGEYEGKPIFSHLLEMARKTTYRVWAVNTPYDKKDVLKIGHGYKWSDGTDPASPIKAWYRDGVQDLDAEIAMLATTIYSSPQEITVDEITGRTRYTDRYTQRIKITVQPAPATP